MITARIPAFLTLASMPVALLLLAALPLPGAQAIKDVTLTGNTTLSGNVTSNATITGATLANATLSGATTLAGTITATGTFNLANATVTPPSNIVTTTAAQTLTNKTLTSPALSGASTGNGATAYLGASGVKPNEYDAFYVISPTITEYIGRGLDVKTIFAGSYAATGINSYFYTSGSTAVDHLHNYQGHLFHQGTYTLPFGAGYWSFLDNSAGTGAWTNGYGFYFAGISGTISNHWAFYDVGGSPTRHSGKVYLGEDVIAPSSLPNTQLYVRRAHAAISGGLSSPTAILRSTNTAAVGVGGSLALGGESGAAAGSYNFGLILGAKEQAGETYNGYLAFFTTDTGSNNSEKARVTSAGNLLVGTTTDVSGAGSVKVSGFIEGTEQGSSPAAPAANGWRLYAKDNGSGKSVLYVRFASGAEQQLAIEP